MCVSVGSPAPNHTIHALLWLVSHRLSPLTPAQALRVFLPNSQWWPTYPGSHTHRNSAMRSLH